MTYQIRRAGQILCTGSYPNLGYSPSILKDMARNGLHLYVGGKRVKIPLRNGNSGNGKET